jgi:hypothetical protein
MAGDELKPFSYKRLTLNRRAMADFRYFVMAKFYETWRRENDWDRAESIYRVAKRFGVDERTVEKALAKFPPQ